MLRSFAGDVTRSISELSFLAMETSPTLPASTEKWGLPGESEEHQGGQHESQDQTDCPPTEVPPPMSSLEEGSPRGVLDMRAFEAPQLRHRRAPHPASQFKKVEKFIPSLQQSQPQPQQVCGGSDGVTGVSTAHDDKGKRAVGKAEVGVRLWSHGGDSAFSPAASTAAPPTAATGATSPFTISSCSPSLPSSPREGERLAETDRSSMREEKPRAPLLLKVAPKRPIVQEQEHRLQKRDLHQLQQQQEQVLHKREHQHLQQQKPQWAWLFSEAAGRTQKQLHLLQKQLFVHPLLLAAVPSLLLATVPATGIICILAAGLLPLCGFIPLVVAVLLLGGKLGDFLQGKAGGSVWLRLGAGAAVLLLPLLLLPAAGFFAAGGLMLLLLLPLLCLLLPLGMLCFLPLAVFATGLLLALSLFSPGEGRPRKPALSATS